MNWIRDLVRPRIKQWVGQKKDVPDNLWHKCSSCGASIFHRELVAQLFVCDNCDHHLRMPVEDRLNQLYGEAGYELMESPKVPQDPLRFKDRKSYKDRLKEARTKTNRDDALLVAFGKIDGQDCVSALFDFSFQGGSMGVGVGEAFVKAAELAVMKKSAFLAIPSSGGARMQEGILSLMQLPRTIIAVNRLRRHKLPFIVLLADPTTGGVSASFAMLGDIHLAEPGATIGFAGRRVIEQTVRETLPEGFQTAEYLLEHGMVDAVVARKNQPQVIGNILSLLMNKPKDINPSDYLEKSEYQPETAQKQKA